MHLDTGWVAELADFQFMIKYRPGTANRDAYALPRIPTEQSMPLNLFAYMNKIHLSITPILLVGDYRFDNLCGSHLQSQVIVLVSRKLKNPVERFDGHR